jgi:hypothetical protein
VHTETLSVVMVLDNVIETHEHKGEFKNFSSFTAPRSH